MGTFVELLKILPLGVPGDGLMGVAVLAALHNDHHVLVILVTVHI